jgi:phosphoribosylformylglycinamidine cyclo-ligase
MDYFAAGRLEPDTAEQVILGFVKACRENGCALIGGETAEMPGFYPPGEYDLAGCIVGWVRRREILDGRRIRPGDVILGVASSGLHTNGYSLARKVLIEREGMSLTKRVPELGRPLGDALLAPHRCYLRTLAPLLEKGWISALVHVTGGGITENTPRVLPAGCRAEVRLGSWPVPPVFELIRRLGRVPEGDMLRTFNMGVGMLAIVPPRYADRVTGALRRKREKFWIVGRIARGRPSVKYLRA